MIYHSDIKKKCSQCGEMKPLNKFYLDSKNKHGRRSHCIACDQMRRNKKQPIRLSKNKTERMCECCRRDRPLEEFRSYARRKTIRLVGKCDDCLARIAKQVGLDLPDRVA